MPRKSIIFPVNNKGGVGKTSLLVDLVSMLSLEYRVGFLDMDGQGSLYSTLTGDYSLVNAETEQYLGLDSKVVELLKSAEFRFAQGSKRLQIKIRATKTPVASFPVGLLYDCPSSREKLESIVQKDMSGVGMLAVDLPPLPHAGLLLDHSLMPVIEAVGTGSDLFPLVVVTPEKNTIDVGLNTFSRVYNYLTRKGVPKSRIHPIVIVNKVATGIDREDNLMFDSLDDHDRAKLRELGMIFDNSTHKESSGFFEFREGFVFQGRKYKVKWMPFIEHIRGGDFHLLQGRYAGLSQFPLLFQIAKDSGYSDEKIARNGVQQTYAEQMNGICHLIRHYTHVSRSRSYVVSKQCRPREKAQTLLVSQIKTGLVEVDALINETAGQDFYKIGDVTISYGYCGMQLVLVHIPTDRLPLEALSTAIAKSEVDLGLGQDRINAWKPGDQANILSRLKAGDYFSAYRNSLIDVSTPPQDLCGNRIDINVMLDGKSYQRQRQLFDEFLGHLDAALAKSHATR